MLTKEIRLKLCHLLKMKFTPEIYLLLCFTVTLVATKTIENIPLLTDLYITNISSIDGGK